MKLRLLSGAAALAMAHAGSALAQTAVTSAEDTGDAERIIITGTGARQVQTVLGDELTLEAPGTSPIKLVERLPGVTFSAADAFGAYEWAVRINIRGFQQQQLGFTLDGIPLGDMSYGNFNGLHISRAIISENLDTVELSQGAGLLSTHSTSNLGGTLQFFSKGPEEEYGGTAAVTVGDDSTFRAFGRLDTGVIDGIGTSAYVSYLNNDTNKWKQGGAQYTDQWNVGIAQPLFGGELSAYLSQSRRRETDFQDLSLEMLDRLGYEWDNFNPNWELAQRVADIANNVDEVNNATGAPVPDGLSDITGSIPTNPAAGDVFPAPLVGVDDAYYDASGLRDDDLGRVSYAVSLGDVVDLSGTVYHHEQEGQGTWYTPYVNPFMFGLPLDTVTSPVSVRTTEYDMVRTGVFGDATVHLGSHEIAAGFWLEDNSFDQSRRFYANTRQTPRDTLAMMRNPFATQWKYDYDFATSVFYVQDAWSISDALTVSGGFKSLKVETDVVTVASGFVAPAPGSDRDLRGSITSEDNFLPQVGVTYDVTDSIELFGGYTENMRAFDLAPFNNQSQASFELVKAGTDPETSKTLEGGLRWNAGALQAVGAVYYVEFDNRLLGTRVGSGIQGNPSIIRNVGGVETKGVELAGAYAFTDDLSLYVSYAYNDSQYKDDVVDGDGNLVQATAGARVVNTPEHLLKSDLTYDNGSLFATLSGAYTGEREQDFDNSTGTIDAHTVFDLSTGWRFDGENLLDGLEIQLNVTNLLDEEYISTIGTNGFTAGDAYFNQSLMVGPPRQVFLTLRKSF